MPSNRLQRSRNWQNSAPVIKRRALAVAPVRAEIQKASPARAAKTTLACEIMLGVMRDRASDRAAAAAHLLFRVAIGLRSAMMRLPDPLGVDRGIDRGDGGGNGQGPKHLWRAGGRMDQ